MTIHLFRRKDTFRTAFSLIEIVVTMTILAILVSFAAPSVIQTMEQSHADLAGAGLRMINSAQRFYWLENRTYAPDLQTLQAAGLIDDDLTNASRRYEFATTGDADGFTATATRRQIGAAGQSIYNGAWQGSFSTDETGAITGSVQGGANALGQSPVLTPGI
ncbi:type IV pilin protein [Stieleria varia]|uniref:Type II secretion system protein G n=1 Tax=Stieleria varia TaxID=2528005 RepID=A0A5C6B8Y4_9BACT|nr:prepilin-type N-terminal cleavage/methylation domain-containing protein [Stieleria varia]TWU08187.1 hypothetical protein Pla52n_07690 [Stieleria varia]